MGCSWSRPERPAATTELFSSCTDSDRTISELDRHGRDGKPHASLDHGQDAHREMKHGEMRESVNAPMAYPDMRESEPSGPSTESTGIPKLVGELPSSSLHTCMDMPIPDADRASRFSFTPKAFFTRQVHRRSPYTQRKADGEPAKLMPIDLDAVNAARQSFQVDAPEAARSALGEEAVHALDVAETPLSSLPGHMDMPIPDADRASRFSFTPKAYARQVLRRSPYVRRKADNDPSAVATTGRGLSPDMPLPRPGHRARLNSKSRAASSRSSRPCDHSAANSTAAAPSAADQAVDHTATEPVSAGQRAPAVAMQASTESRTAPAQDTAHGPRTDLLVDAPEAARSALGEEAVHALDVAPDGAKHGISMDMPVPEADRFSRFGYTPKAHTPKAHLKQRSGKRSPIQKQRTNEMPRPTIV